MTIPFIDPKGDPERWEPPTMKSELLMVGNPLVTCKCGRQVNADMMRGLGDGFGCDACVETLFRTKALTREQFALSHEAPETVLVKARLLDTVKDSNR